jgi:hypothetical protein
MKRLSWTSTVLAVVVFAPWGQLVAQGVVVDQGRFNVSLNGQQIGTEDFTIRRAGVGREEAIFANADIHLTRNGRPQEIRPLLRAAPPDGVATGYQVEVTGVDSMTLRLSRVGRRYVAVISTALGEEQREFPADADSHILELDVAHLYYFLKSAEEGDTIPVLEPRTRSRLTLETGAATDEDLRVGESVVPARRVEFTSGDDVRRVWYDRLGRVLRVSIPGRGYLAERTDVLH